MGKLTAQWTLGLAALAGVLDWVAGFGWHSLTPAEAAWWVAAVNAVALVIASWKTRPIAPQVWTYAVSALAALAGAYGLHLSQGNVSAFSTALLAVLALFTHGQVSPAADIHSGAVVNGRRVN